MQRLVLKAPRNIPDEATVSARALIGFGAAFRSLVKCGSSPQRSASRRRVPVSGCRRTTSAFLAGREVPGWRQVRRTLCLKELRMNLAESLEAKRPHMVSLPRCLPSITSGGISRVKTTNKSG